jgi:hypothetical protein
LAVEHAVMHWKSAKTLTGRNLRRIELGSEAAYAANRGVAGAFGKADLA